MGTGSTGPSWVVFALAASVLIAVAVGWYFLSVVVVDSSPRTAAGEAIGVILALLLVVSVIGAVRGSRQPPSGTP
jgi:hypothetical protein